MIKNIIFDNGGVIVKYSYETYLDYFKFDINVQNDLNTLFTTQAWGDLSKGLITHEDFFNICINKFPHYKEEITKILDKNNLIHLIPVYNETVEFIKELKSNNYKVFLLSDIVEDTIWYLNKYIDNFESLFDGLVYSCRVGMVKKEGKVFDYILDKYNLNPNETLFLDDSITNLNEASKKNILTYRFLNPSIDINRIKELIK